MKYDCVDNINKSRSYGILLSMEQMSHHMAHINLVESFYVLSKLLKYGIMAFHSESFHLSLFQSILINE